MFNLLVLLSVVISVFGYSGEFTDSYIVPKWAYGLAVALPALACLAVGSSLNRTLRLNISAVSVGIVAVCSLQAVYGILQYAGALPSHSLYRVAGSFDNPAGFASCLCVGLPFAGVLLSGRNGYARCGAWLAVAVIVVAVALSESRAGMISVAAVGLACLSCRSAGRRRVWRYALLAVFTVLFAVGYWLKRDSADGRLLIWRCSLELIKEAPLFGHGTGCFEAHYMDAQADYFGRNGQEGRYALLADNVKHPFNEYLSVWLNFGLVGLAVLAGAAVWLWRRYRERPLDENRAAARALLAVGVFSFFSYPFTYPFTWMVTLLSAYLLAREPVRSLFGRKRARIAACAVVLAGSFVGMAALVERVLAEWEWNGAARLALKGKFREALPAYRRLEGSFASNPYFLYNYAAVLQQDNRYAESLRVASLCRRYWADYDLELILGENLRRLGRTEEAAARYRCASLMCPSRFLPLYRLLRLYKGAGDRERTERVAREMMAKPVKVDSPSVRMMRREAGNLLGGRTMTHNLQ